MVQYSQSHFDASFAALSDATRRGVLEQLGRADASITDLAEKFHMTLTDRIEDLSERARFAEAVTDFFAFMADEEVVLDRLVLFREAPGAPFLRLRDYLLTGEA